MQKDPEIVELTAESLAAVTGLWPKGPPDRKDLLAAEALPSRWRARVRSWLRGVQAPLDWRPPPEDQSKLDDKISAPVDADAMTAWLTALNDPDVGTSYAAVVTRSREFLQRSWPRMDTGGIVPAPLPLSPDDYAEVWGLVRVLDSPDVLLDELAAWTIEMSQVAALKTCYPRLYAMLLDFCDAELVEHATRERPIVWQIEDLVRILRGLPPEAEIVLPKTGADAAPATRREYRVDFKSTRTPSESVTAGASH